MDGGPFVTSYPPPEPLSRKLGLRPRYLVGAMIVTWFVGVQGLTMGLHVASYLRHGNPAVVEVTTHTPREALEVARLRALGDMPDVAFPLAAAQIILSGLLVVSSGLAMGGRRGARALALQAICAHVAFAAVDYALTKNVRAAGFDAYARTAIEMGGEVKDSLGVSAWWRERIAYLVFHGVTMAIGAFALTRDRTKAFFAAVARATERAEEDS
jgi:hypothetical protein